MTYLPAWVIVGLTWKLRLFVHTNAGIIVILHVLLGFVLASWSFFIAAPFGKSPQLAAVVTTFLAIVFAILALVIKANGSGAVVLFSLIFPPMFYIFALKAICGYENHEIATNALKGDPDRGLVLLPLLIIAIVSDFKCLYYICQSFIVRLTSSSGLTLPLSLKDICTMSEHPRHHRGLRDAGYSGRDQHRTRQLPQFRLIWLYQFVD